MQNNESYIRSIVRQEIQTQSNGARFGLNPQSTHEHTGIDSPKINQNNILPGNSVEGSIRFAQTTIYKIGVNFNPTSVFVHGNITGDLGEKFITTGVAEFGPSLYLQPSTSTSVTPGGKPQDIIQSATYFGTDAGGSPHTIVTEEHIASVEYPSGTIRARATIIGYDSKNVLVQVNTLNTGWAMNLSFTIT